MVFLCSQPNVSLLSPWLYPVNSRLETVSSPPLRFTHCYWLFNLCIWSVNRVLCPRGLVCWFDSPFLGWGCPSMITQSQFLNSSGSTDSIWDLHDNKHRKLLNKWVSDYTDCFQIGPECKNWSWMGTFTQCRHFRLLCLGLWCHSFSGFWFIPVVRHFWVSLKAHLGLSVCISVCWCCVVWMPCILYV